MTEIKDTEKVNENENEKESKKQKPLTRPGEIKGKIEVPDCLNAETAPAEIKRTPLQQSVI